MEGVSNTHDVYQYIEGVSNIHVYQGYMYCISVESYTCSFSIKGDSSNRISVTLIVQDLWPMFY